MEKKNKRALDRYDSDDYWKKFYKRSHFGYIDQDISMIFRSLNILKNKTMYMLDNRISSVMMYSEIYAFGKYLKSISKNSLCKTDRMGWSLILIAESM